LDTSTQHLKLDAGQYEGMMKMKIMLLGQGKSTEAKPMSLAMVPPPTIWDFMFSLLPYNRRSIVLFSFFDLTCWCMMNDFRHKVIYFLHPSILIKGQILPNVKCTFFMHGVQNVGWAYILCFFTKLSKSNGTRCAQRWGTFSLGTSRPDEQQLVS
jgi:hypothetical protein